MGRATYAIMVGVALGAVSCGGGSEGRSGTDGPGGATPTGGSSSGGAGFGGEPGTAGAATGGTATGGTATGGTATGGTGPCGPTPPSVGATTRELYVEPGADDATADGTRAAPYGTLGAAAAQASAGTRIVLLAGTHVGSTYLDGLAGTETAPIVIAGEGEAILDAGGAAEVLHLAEAEHVVIEDLELRGATTNGLNIDDGGTYATPAHHVILRRLVLHDIGTGGNHDCIKLSGLDDFHVVDSDLSGCNAGDAIDMVGCHEGVITGNRIHDTPGGGVQAKGGSADILVHGNWFVDVGERSVNAGGSTGLEFFRPLDATYEAARLVITANVFVRSEDTPIAFVGCDACAFVNNTVLDPLTRVSRILQETTDARFVPCRNGTFVNNVIVLRRAAIAADYQVVNIGPGTAPETFTFGSNLWYASDDPTYVPALPSPLVETGSVTAQAPDFVDEAALDVHLEASSPAIGAGREVTGSPGDLEGRCWATPPSMGALER